MTAGPSILLGPLPGHPKIVARSALPEALAKVRSGRRVVFTNGCYDILHPGHVDLLARAKAEGDLLVVGLNEDDSVRRLKGPSRPVNDFEARAFVIAHLACVDFVTGFAEDTPLELVRELQPDVLVKGGDWPVEAIVGREVVQARGGRVLSLPLLPGHSTTGVIDRALALCGATKP